MGSVSKLIIFQSLNEIKEYLNTYPSYVILGKGSNSIIDPNTTKDIIQISQDFIDTKVDGEFLHVSAGCTVSNLMKICEKNGVSGFEFAAGVPASVGGMLAMNFGCWGYEISDFVEKVRVIDAKGQDFWLSKSDISFSYRYSSFAKDNLLIIEAVLKGVNDDPAKIKKEINRRIFERIEKQPLKQPTFGSVFKNPSTTFSGKLIEEIGYKGKVFGSVKMSEKHANFMINVSEATFDDVLNLIKDIQLKVKKTYDIELEPEVKIIS